MTEQGIRRVLNGFVGQEFPVHKVTQGVAGPVAHVTDPSTICPVMKRPARWSLGWGDYVPQPPIQDVWAALKDVTEQLKMCLDTCFEDGECDDVESAYQHGWAILHSAELH